MKELNIKKRVLLIAFHFPPQAASSGIQRTLSFSKHLGLYGWEPMVLSAHSRAYEQRNSSQMASVPAHLVVRRAFALDAKRHIGIRGRYLELAAMPDRWITWWAGAVPVGLSLIRRYRPQVIWSTFPIATSHLIGLTLHRLTGLPWVADFRDPMLKPSCPPHGLQRRIYDWIERQAVKRCKTATFTTFGAMSACRERFPHSPASKFTVIENGYDDDEFDIRASTTQGAPAEGGGGCITLLHSGTMYRERDPSAFFDAIAVLRKNGSTNISSLRVVLRAPGDADAITECARLRGVSDIVNVLPPVPYDEALNEMLAADGLLIFQGTPFNTQVPAKVYEYFRARKPILGLVDPAGETARVLRAAGFSSVAAMDNADSIAPALARFIEQISCGEAYVASDDIVASTSRIHRARQFADILDQAV